MVLLNKDHNNWFLLLSLVLILERNMTMEVRCDGRSVVGSLRVLLFVFDGRGMLDEQNEQKSK